MPAWSLSRMTADEFLLKMAGMGSIVGMALVGVMEGNEEPGRGSRREMELPLHRDGEYSKELADAQGGYYTKQERIDMVGLYCLRSGNEKCVTTFDTGDEVELEQGQALIFDNQRLLHGRRGVVGREITD